MREYIATVFFPFLVAAVFKLKFRKCIILVLLIFVKVVKALENDEDDEKSKQLCKS